MWLHRVESILLESARRMAAPEWGLIKHTIDTTADGRIGQCDGVNAHQSAVKGCAGAWAEYTSKKRPCAERTAMKDLTGKPAIPFALRDSVGEIHRLEDYRGQWLLLVFHRHLG
jgi:hypothetical protein